MSTLASNKDCVLHRYTSRRRQESLNRSFKWFIQKCWFIMKQLS